MSGVRSTGELNYNFATKKKSIFFAYTDMCRVFQRCVTEPSRFPFNNLGSFQKQPLTGVA